MFTHFLISYCNFYFDRTWIGLRYSQLDGEYHWSDESILHTYDWYLWPSIPPLVVSSDDVCVYYSYDGGSPPTWQTKPCHQNAETFLCKTYSKFVLYHQFRCLLGHQLRLPLLMIKNESFEVSLISDRMHFNVSL